MKTTYLIENNLNEVLGYSSQLHEAKRILEHKTDSGKITKLVGHYFGEGYHAYYLIYDGKKYTRAKK
jgi:hypothetical protein